jgi:hypothetical protein
MFRSLSARKLSRKSSSSAEKSSSAAEKSLKQNKLRSVAALPDASPAKNKSTKNTKKLRKSKSSDEEDSGSSDDRGRQNAKRDKKIRYEKKSQKKRDGLVNRAINVSDGYIREYKAPLKGVKPTVSRYDDDDSDSSDESAYEPPTSYKQPSKAQDDDERDKQIRYEKKSQQKRDGLVNRAINVSDGYIREYKAPLKGVKPTVSRYDDDDSDSSDESAYEPPTSYNQRSKAQDDDESSDASSYHGKEYRQPSKSQVLMDDDDDDDDDDGDGDDDDDGDGDGDGDSSIESTVGSERRLPPILKAAYHNIPDTSALSKEQKEKDEHERMVAELELETLKVQEQLNATEHENGMERRASYQRMMGMDGGNQERCLDTDVQGMSSSQTDEMAEMIQQLQLETQMMENKLAEAEEEVAVNRTLLSQASLHKLAMFEDEADEDEFLDDSNPQISIANDQHLADDDDDDYGDDESLDLEEVLQVLETRQRNQHPAKKKQQHPLSSSFNRPSRVNRSRRPDPSDARAPSNTSFTHGEFNDSSSSWLSCQIASHSNDDDNDPMSSSLHEPSRGNRSRKPDPSDARVVHSKSLTQIAIADDQHLADDETRQRNQRPATRQQHPLSSSLHGPSRGKRSRQPDPLDARVSRSASFTHGEFNDSSSSCWLSFQIASHSNDDANDGRAPDPPECNTQEVRKVRGGAGGRRKPAGRRVSDVMEESMVSASSPDHRSNSKSHSAASSRSASKSPKRSTSKADSSALRRRVKLSESEASHSKESSKEKDKERGRPLKKLEKLEKEPDKTALPRPSLERKVAEESSEGSLLERKERKMTKERSSKACSLERKLVEESSKSSLLEKKKRKMTKESSSRSLNGRPKKEKESNPRDLMTNKERSSRACSLDRNKVVEKSSKSSVLEKGERKMTKESSSRSVNGRPKKEKDSNPRDLMTKERSSRACSLDRNKVVEKSSKSSVLEKGERKMTKEGSSRSVNGRPKKEKEESSPRDIIIEASTPSRRQPKPV